MPNLSDIVASGSGGGSVLTGKTLWVDGTNGNNTTAIAGRFDKPYLTIAAAIAAAVSGNTVHVRPGIYAEALTLKNGVDLYFEPGASLEATTSPPVSADRIMLTDGGVAVACKIAGRLRIVNTDPSVLANTQALTITNASSNIDMEVDTIYGDGGSDSGAGLVQVTAGTLTLRAKNITALGPAAAIRMDAGSVTLTALTITATNADGIGIELRGGTFSGIVNDVVAGADGLHCAGSGAITYALNANTISATLSGGDGILFANANASGTIRAHTISGGSGLAAISASGGTHQVDAVQLIGGSTEVIRWSNSATVGSLTVSGARLVSTGDTPAIRYPSGAANKTLVLRGVSIEAGVTSNSITAASAQTVTAYDSTMNRPVHANVTIANGVDVSTREQTNGDANVTWTAGKTLLRQTAALTANRTGTLPAANAYAAGTVLVFQDAQTTGAFGIAFSRAGTDTLNGGTGAVTFFTGKGAARLVTDGVSAWEELDQSGKMITRSVAVSFTATGNTTVFTVPAGRTFVCTGAVAVITSVSGYSSTTTAIWRIFNGSGAIMSNNGTPSAAWDTVGEVSPAPVFNTATGPFNIAAAGTNVQVNVNTASSSTSLNAIVHVTGFYY